METVDSRTSNSVIRDSDSTGIPFETQSQAGVKPRVSAPKGSL